MKWLWLEDTSGGYLVQTCCSSRDALRQLPRTMSRWLLDISMDGDSATSLGDFCQPSVTLTVKKGFLMLRGNLLCFSLCQMTLVLSLGTTEKSLALSSVHLPFRYLYRLTRSP